MKTEGKYEFSPLAEALLIIDSYWEKENLPSLRGLDLASLPCSNGSPHIQEYKSNETELDEWVKKRGHGIVSIGKKGFIWEELGERVKYDQTILSEIFKEIILKEGRSSVWDTLVHLKRGTTQPRQNKTISLSCLATLFPGIRERASIFSTLGFCSWDQIDAQ